MLKVKKSKSKKTILKKVKNDPVLSSIERLRNETQSAIKDSEARLRNETQSAIKDSEARLRNETQSAIKDSEARLRNEIHSSAQSLLAYMEITKDEILGAFKDAHSDMNDKYINHEERILKLEHK